ncbi:hypothetical protein Cgig2_026587 [Carnegiea gigantea]|uniref:Uncharacterized protein n=1 Tax=Carnegiea gigantea TaxID=171969 RepID=A0A9Q1KJ95_9CARY|nr:hypothetical protein Cgig2_026587 [Carnegiea gigantea]
MYRRHALRVASIIEQRVDLFPVMNHFLHAHWSNRGGRGGRNKGRGGHSGGRTQADRSRGRETAYQVHAQGEYSAVASTTDEVPTSMPTASFTLEQVQQILSLIKSPKSVHEKLLDDWASKDPAPVASSQPSPVMLGPAQNRLHTGHLLHGPQQASAASPSGPAPQPITVDRGSCPEGIGGLYASELEEACQNLKLTYVEAEAVVFDNDGSDERVEHIAMCLYGRLLMEKSFNSRTMKFKELVLGNEASKRKFEDKITTGDGEYKLRVMDDEAESILACVKAVAAL